MKKFIDKFLYRLYRKAALRYCKIEQEKCFECSRFKPKEERIRHYRSAESFENVINYIELDRVNERYNKLKAKN